MPIAAAIPAIGGAILGGLSGATNKRPPSLDKTQSTTLDSLLKQLYPTVGTTPTEDPKQRALMFGNIAQEGVGGANRVTNSLVSRGLGRSGLLARGLVGNSQAITGAQNNTDLALQQQAISQRNTTISQILSLLGVSNVPGQSGIGGFLSGFAGPASYALSKMNFGGSPGKVSANPLDASGGGWG